MENQTVPPSVDPAVFRKTMGCFATGVTIVTTKNGSELQGMTVNSFTSVSLQPPLILVCLSLGARTTAAVEARGWFAVHILEERQKELSDRFARAEEDHYAGVEYALNDYDLPELPGCLARLICRVHRVDPGGDHRIILGEVVKAEMREGRPLLFSRGAYGAMASAPPASGGASPVP
ncbi:MAG TPA: flavin reductase family protein [Terriglobia bacterium]|nr:flavin reductase family protein [Terriglobia bacterium]